MEITKQERCGVPFYACPDPAWAGAAHGFSTRQGGVSPAPMDSLNLGANRGDDPANVRENFTRFCAAVGADPNALVKNHQIHSDIIRPVTRADVMDSPEAPGTFELYQGRKYKVYRGMGSIAAMENGSKDRYFQENARKLVPEGVEGRVAYKGSVEDTVFQMIGGIRSGMGYCGCPTIEDLKQNGKFVKISAAALRESHPHDIHITKEAPNYASDAN